MKHGYRIVWSGPKPVGKYKSDPLKFKLIAERTMAEEAHGPNAD
jgi:hypothetical protein